MYLKKVVGRFIIHTVQTTTVNKLNTDTID